MQPLCWGHLRADWVDRMLQTDFLRPDAMPIRLEQTLFLLMSSLIGGHDVVKLLLSHAGQKRWLLRSHPRNISNCKSIHLWYDRK